MKLHEYQTKDILKKYGLPIPEYRVASTPDEAYAAAQELGGRVVIKAQVLVGGRGKAGGVKLAETADEARQKAQDILGLTIKGIPVHKVLVSRTVDIQKEFYLGIIVDRAIRHNVVILSPAGGVDIEEVAASTPERIYQEALDPAKDPEDIHLEPFYDMAEVPSNLLRPLNDIVRNLVKAYTDSDANLLEINPLVIDTNGMLQCVDAKMVIDDNALPRHPEAMSLRDVDGEDPLEIEAQQKGIAYVGLDGTIGIIGNGAGLVMGTMDEIKRAGGAPANFLDVGGGAKAEMVRNCFDLVRRHPSVKGIFVNIFGGITRCDEVAQGILDATSGMELKVPVVIRFTGTRADEGRKKLEGSRFVALEDMQEAAKKIVELAR